MYRDFLQVGFLIELLILVAVFAFAAWKGEQAEKLGAAFNLAAGLLAAPVQHYRGAYTLGIDTPGLILLGIDGLLAAGFLWLALRYASLWLGGALLLQAVQFSLHAYYLMMTLPHDWTYATVNNLDTDGINVLIVIGTLLVWRARRRLARAGDP
ncbi:MAG: hypothetical protein ACREEX_02690, partial [Caulobacteraceae bacterium]